MTETPLLPCPFCGSPPNLVEFSTLIQDPNGPTFLHDQQSWGYAVLCDCSVMKRSSRAEWEFWRRRDEAVKAWNTRPLQQ